MARFELKLPREQAILLLLVGSSLFINNYDLGIYALALPQIQASLAIPEQNVGFYTGIMRFGVLLAFPLAFMADVVGRKRLLLITIAGMTVATLLTGIAQDHVQFLILQTLARCFSYAEDMLCYVIVAEEIDPRMRGWALGRLAALGTLGYALSSLLYTQIDVLPHGWRDFYFIGAAGLVVILLARRRLQETQRFADLRAARPAIRRSFHEHLTPIFSLVRAYPGRFAALVATTAPYAFGVATALAFTSKFLQETHGYSPKEVGLLQLLGGAISILGYFAAGRLSDRLGRRAVLSVSIGLVSVLLAAFYLTGDPRLLIASWIGALFAYFASDVTLSALGSELFPTSYRSTSAAARSVINVTAAVAGLAVESAIYPLVGSHAAAIVLLLCAAPFAILPVLLFLPETAMRSLDEVSPEVHLPPTAP
ncbi:MAG: MFS transporter [Parvibaculum sp.]|uniref:MFS transporter n=1 Tax=Parvibaculum sp. TaxID=2024848 RepID=UPI0025FE3B99|nr:MFS transporter [Parvibaculum sp.]MCE9648928.1 MFS transporter [Parvibaculum sp.]